jgi:hypothetical protein
MAVRCDGRGPRIEAATAAASTREEARTGGRGRCAASFLAAVARQPRKGSVSAIPSRSTRASSRYSSSTSIASARGRDLDERIEPSCDRDECPAGPTRGQMRIRLSVPDSRFATHGAKNAEGELALCAKRARHDRAVERTTVAAAFNATRHYGRHAALAPARCSFARLCGAPGFVPLGAAVLASLTCQRRTGVPRPRGLARPCLRRAWHRRPRRRRHRQSPPSALGVQRAAVVHPRGGLVGRDAQPGAV